ncbi:MAG: transposase [Flavisolibacter sp.]|nr:transposase [Flavisolibacter sp.]
MLNAYIERKNGSLRRELLNAYLFYNFSKVHVMCEEWRRDYNHERPHKSMGNLSPLHYARRWRKEQQPYPSPIGYRVDTILTFIEDATTKAGIH